jgi:hypothetical protein
MTTLGRIARSIGVLAVLTFVPLSLPIAIVVTLARRWGRK